MQAANTAVNGRDAAKRGNKRAMLKAFVHIAVWLPACSMLADLYLGRMGMLPAQSVVYWTGVWATALLLLTLAITPLRHLLRWNAIVQSRRIIGVAALAYTVAHVVAFLVLHGWSFAHIWTEMTTRATLIVASISMLGLMALGATSTDAAVSRLGAENWRRLHGFNLLITGLAVLHYMMSPGTFDTQYLMAGFFFWLCAWRLLARNGTPPGAAGLAGLALASVLFVGSFEFGWQALHKRLALRDTYEDLIINFDDGLPSIWIVMIVSIGVALVALFGQQRAASLRRTKSR